MRESSNGAQDIQGGGGCYWMSSVYDANGGYRCYFHGSGVSPNSADPRGYGFSVRCVDATPPTVLVGDKEWTLGNLIADGPNGATPAADGTAMGLYFQFGSLIGSPDGSTASTTAIAVKPDAYSGTAWGKAYITSGEIGADNPADGTGDPCRYYLGSAYRLPTNAEIEALIAAGSTWSNTGRTFGGTLHVRASGSRDSNGSTSNVGSYGYCWGSATNSNFGYSLLFSSGSANLDYNYRNNGISVRCVRN